MHRAARAATLAGLLLATGTAAAADDCILDNCADKRPLPTRRYDRDGAIPFERHGGAPSDRRQPGGFDFYVLALSWSPSFCAIRDDRRESEQCRRDGGIGFTVHGLWPQYARGYPSNCRDDAMPSRAALASTDGVYPNEGLARYEWRKHGTCSGLNPLEYFAAARAARDAVIVPVRFKEPHDIQHLSPAEVIRAFTEANVRLRPGMIAVDCRAETLEDVRICFSKDRRSFQACPDVVRDGCRAGEIDVPPVR